MAGAAALEAALAAELGGGGGGGGGGADVNPSVGALLRAWASEKASPELLPFRADLVEPLREALDAQLKALREGGVPGTYVPGLYRLDAERVKFALAAYLRARLGKVRARARGARGAVPS